MTEKIIYTKEDIERFEKGIGISVENSSVIDTYLAIARIKILADRCYKIYKKHGVTSPISRPLLDKILGI